MLSFLYRRLELNALYDAGLTALDARRYRLARVIAAEARRRRNTMAYEIEARALWGLGRRSKAVDVLWKATRRYPTLYVLWGFLGEYLSDLGRLDDATVAFMRAGETGASPCTTDYNLGVIAWRRGRYDESVRLMQSALAAYDSERDNGYKPDLLCAEIVHSLISAGRVDEASRLYAQVKPSELGDEVRERVASAMAQAKTRSE